ncbi:hypothetical protein RHMOL_Rhmol06G0190200 [Rhododendron molle]|uniref:Uncharacterized protein n=1 Tax=Rhododendron molle TaxID=49168 RepID=A0ACC0NFU9_RHOML|nr:hypothetical protein RHMOL_Rhmol06G0190200 [Rhododendron molle]
MLKRTRENPSTVTPSLKTTKMRKTHCTCSPFIHGVEVVVRGGLHRQNKFSQSLSLNHDITDKNPTLTPRKCGFLKLSLRNLWPSLFFFLFARFVQMNSMLDAEEDEREPVDGDAVSDGNDEEDVPPQLMDPKRTRQYMAKVQLRGKTRQNERLQVVKHEGDGGDDFDDPDLPN